MNLILTKVLKQPPEDLQTALVSLGLNPINCELLLLVCRDA